MTTVSEAYTRARAEEAVRIVHVVEELERVEIRRAARLLAPSLTFVRDASGWLDKSEVSLPSGRLGQRLRLTGLPIQRRGGTQPRAPEVLLWRYYDGRRWTVEPVAKLVRTTGPYADYGLAHTNAARAFGNLLDDLEDATVQLSALIGGGPSRTAEVVFE
jgi:hypothetical protein